jgi:hypothetical protein
MVSNSDQTNSSAEERRAKRIEGATAKQKASEERRAKLIEGAVAKQKAIEELRARKKKTETDKQPSNSDTPSEKDVVSEPKDHNTTSTPAPKVNVTDTGIGLNGGNTTTITIGQPITTITPGTPTSPIAPLPKQKNEVFDNDQKNLIKLVLEKAHKQKFDENSNLDYFIEKDGISYKLDKHNLNKNIELSEILYNLMTKYEEIHADYTNKFGKNDSVNPAESLYGIESNKSTYIKIDINENDNLISIRAHEDGVKAFEDAILYMEGKLGIDHNVSNHTTAHEPETKEESSLDKNNFDIHILSPEVKKYAQDKLKDTNEKINLQVREMNKSKSKLLTGLNNKSFPKAISEENTKISKYSNELKELEKEKSQIFNAIKFKEYINFAKGAFDQYENGEYKYKKKQVSEEDSKLSPYSKAMYENQLVNNKITLMKEEIKDIAKDEGLRNDPLKNIYEIKEKIKHIKDEEASNSLSIKESYNNIINLIGQSSYKTQQLKDLEVFLTEMSNIDPVSNYQAILEKLTNSTSNIQNTIKDVRLSFEKADNALKNAELKKEELLKKEASIDKFVSVSNKANFAFTTPGNFKNVTTDLINLELIKNTEPTVTSIKTKLNSFKSSIEDLLNNIVEKQFNFSEKLVVKTNLEEYVEFFVGGELWNYLSDLISSDWHHSNKDCLKAIKELKTQNSDLFKLDFIDASNIENNILPKEDVDNLVNNINDAIKMLREFDLASLNVELGNPSNEQLISLYELAKSFKAKVENNKDTLNNLLNQVTNDINLLEDLPSVEMFTLECKVSDKSVSVKNQIEEDLKKVGEEIETLTQARDNASKTINHYTSIIDETEQLTSHFNSIDSLVKRLEKLEKLSNLVEELNNPESETNILKDYADNHLKSIYAQMSKLWDKVSGLKDTSSIYEHETINDLKEKLYGTVDGKEVGIIQKIEEFKILKLNSEEKSNYLADNYNSYKRIEEDKNEIVYNGEQLRVNKLGYFLNLIEDIELKLKNNSENNEPLVGINNKYCYSVYFWIFSNSFCWETNNLFTSGITESKIEAYLADGFFAKNTLESEINNLESLRIKLYGGLGKGIYIHDGKTADSHTPVDSNDTATETTGNYSTLFTESHG